MVMMCPPLHVRSEGMPGPGNCQLRGPSHFWMQRIEIAAHVPALRLKRNGFLPPMRMALLSFGAGASPSKDSWSLSTMFAKPVCESAIRFA